VRVWEQATAADNLAARLGNTLGLDPSGRARLKQTVATTEASLADLAARGAEITRRRDLALIEDQGADQEHDQ
jgi:hypothetical protein